MICLGFTEEQWRAYERKIEMVQQYRKAEVPDKMPLKDFKKKFVEIPTLGDYSKKRLPDWWWGTWTKKTYEQSLPPKSSVNPELLQAACGAAGCGGTKRLHRVLQRLRCGATLGCTGAARLPTMMKNNDAAFRYGERVVDALQEWIVKGCAVGP